MIKLLKPFDKEKIALIEQSVIDFLNAYDKQRKLIKDDYKFVSHNFGLCSLIRVEKYCQKAKSNYPCKPIDFEFDITNESVLAISTDHNFNNIVYQSHITKNKLSVYNLLRNQTYYWKINDLVNNEQSEIRSFVTCDYPRLMKFGNLLNVRDFGGYITKFGNVIKQGYLYRGAELVFNTYQVHGTLGRNQVTYTHAKSVDDNDLANLKLFLNNGTEIDFRGEKESNYINISLIENVKFCRLPVDSYDYLLKNSDKFKLSYQKFFELLSQVNIHPIYLHCWGGADRTGTACFLLGGLLGMSYTDLVIEFELTSFAGNIRTHYKKNNEFAWVHFHKMVDYLMQYGKKYNLDNDIQKIIEHFLINKFGIPLTTIDKVKKIFLM